MSNGSISRRYARALMAIGVEEDSFEAMGQQLGAFARAMSTSDELSETLSNPAFPRADRWNIVEAILTHISASKTVKNFFALLLDRERLAALPGISRELDRMIDERLGRIEAEVVSAQPLSKAQVSELTKTLEAMSGKKVELSRREDPDLLGGVVTKLGDFVYDGSLRTQLARMRIGLAD